MTAPQVLAQARRGDPQAMAQLLTEALSRWGATVEVQWQQQTLVLTLDATDPLPQTATVALIQRGFSRLHLQRIPRQVTVQSFRPTETLPEAQPDWQTTFTLPGPTEAQPLYQSDRFLVVMVHLLPLLGYLTVLNSGLLAMGAVPFLLPWRVVPPLLLLLMQGNGGGFVAAQAKAALNFQISMVIYWVIVLLLYIVLVGIVLSLPLALFEVIMIMRAAVRAAEGQSVRYPLALRFIP